MKSCRYLLQKNLLEELIVAPLSATCPNTPAGRCALWTVGVKLGEPEIKSNYSNIHHTPKRKSTDTKTVKRSFTVSQGINLYITTVTSQFY